MENVQHTNVINSLCCRWSAPRIADNMSPRTLWR